MRHRRGSRSISFAGLLFLVCLNTALAKVIHVPADQPTIQAGIDAAVNGDKVVVSPGTYLENLNFHGKAITVTSQKGPAQTIIDGGGTAPVAAFISGEGLNSVLNQFTLQNGVGTFDFGYQGGGVSIDNASPTITHNVIQNSTAGDGGGIGVYFGSPLIAENVIQGNYAQFGGAIAIVGGSNAQILQNTIIHNTGGDGAGFELFGAGNVLIRNNHVVSNIASGQGGGFWIVNESDEVIVQNLIAKNGAPSGSQVYSLIPQSQMGFALINNAIVGGSGADAAVIADGFNTNVLIVNNIISAPKDQAALLCNPIYQDGPPIVMNNDAFNPEVAYGDSCSGFGGSNGNVSVNPKFKDRAKQDYRLRATSPVIDAGTNSAPNLPKKDFAGKPRIVDGNGDGQSVVDMGAYEFQPK